MKSLMTIGQAAKTTGLSAKMIRHYEQTGLVKQPPRTDAGYRLYNATQIGQLRFIHQARELGFSLADIRSLLSLWQDPARESRSVKAIADAHLAIITEKMARLSQMHTLLTELSSRCQDNSGADCSILTRLGQGCPGEN